MLASAGLAPSAPRSTDDLSAVLGAGFDEDGDSIAYAYAWYVDGTVESTTTELASGQIRKGQTVELRVTPTDGTDSGGVGSSGEVTVANGLPALTGVSISPSTAYTDTPLTAFESARDPDGDLLSPTWAWTVNSVAVDTFGSRRLGIGTASTDKDGDRITYDISWEVDGSAWTGAVASTTYSGDTIDASSLSGGDVWQCFATASDGEDDSAEASSSTVTVTASTVSFRYGYYWVKATYAAPASAHSTVCSGEGLTATASTVSLTWDATRLSALASDFGYTSAGDTSCCAMTMWCWDGSDPYSRGLDGKCETHNFGTTYDNYGAYGPSSNLRPVFTCTQ